MTAERKPNRLAKEKSPYLLKHSLNPVDWYSWGPEAFAKARNDNKPIFLSIGYSTCHWCTVMEKESFEDREIASLMNKNFISIKVDREERPEVDAYYMDAVQSMTGGGGWPLSVFLTPDLKPFYGGTYFPPEPRYGMPSFRQVLEFVSRVWKERRDEALGSAREITEALGRAYGSAAKGELSKEIVESVASEILSIYDPEHGGFGTAPKFPLPLSISFLLRYHYRTGKEMALVAATKTLDALSAGGIRDHVGGGFHRYSTDRVWLVPHFEKMLYDNALLARTYAEAYQVTGDERYSTVARETLDWMLREMRSDKGGFHSAQDADTKEGEGVYYTWTPSEVEALLGADAGGAFCLRYGITRVGNFDGRSILHLVGEAKEESADKEMKGKLYQARLRRPRPATDEKVLTSWNGLAISALAYAGFVLGERRYVEAAGEAADFVLRNCTADGRLLRRFAGGDAGIEGTLEDYAFLIQGLLDLFEATFEAERLEESLRLAKVMAEDLLDKERGGFYMSREDEPARIKLWHDGPTPSGNSVAAMDLLRLSELTGEDGFREMAGKVFKCFKGRLENQPTGEAYMAEGLDSFLNGMREVVITASGKKEAAEMLEEVARRYLPNSVKVLAIPKNYDRLSAISPLLDGRKPGRKPTAYVCENFVCKLPANSASELRTQLSASGH